MVKGPERLGFTSCLSGTGLAEVRSEEERTSSKERKLSEDILSAMATRCQNLQWISYGPKRKNEIENDVKG